MPFLFLEEIRHASERTRERVALIASLACILALFTVWIVTFDVETLPAGPEASSAAEGSGTADSADGLSGLISNVGRGISVIIGGARNLF